jgi:hypothetical protein
MAVLPHLLREMKETETTRLLLAILPARNQALEALQFDADSLPYKTKIRDALRNCFRLLLKQASWDVRKQVIRQYISILKEQTAEYRKCYEETFFVFSDVEGVVDASEAELIKSHILERLRRDGWSGGFRLASGIGKALTLDDVKTQAARAVWWHALHDDEGPKEDALKWFQEEFSNVPNHVSAALLKDMEEQANRWQTMDRSDLAAGLRQIIESRLF